MSRYSKNNKFVQINVYFKLLSCLGCLLYLAYCGDQEGFDVKINLLNSHEDSNFSLYYSTNNSNEYTPILTNFSLNHKESKDFNLDSVDPNQFIKLRLDTIILTTLKSLYCPPLLITTSSFKINMEFSNGIKSPAEYKQSNNNSLIRRDLAIRVSYALMCRID